MTAEPHAPSDAALQAQVSGSSFYAAMRLMPKAAARGDVAIYGFCRLVDDIADDGTRPSAATGDRARTLARSIWRPCTRASRAGRAEFLKPSVRDFGLRKADFLAVIDGMDMDVAADMRAPDLATLDLYCDRVASAVGRLSTRIFGMDEEPGLELAYQLGRALQLTNILRDIDEDAGHRPALPAARAAEGGRDRHGATRRQSSPIRGSTPPAAALAKLALDHFAASDRLMRAKPHGHLLAPRLMARRLHDRPAADAGGRLGAAAPPRAHRQAAAVVDRAALLPVPMTSSTSRARVHVVGAGLAGLSAAVVAGKPGRPGRAVGSRPPGRRPLPLVFTTASSA